MTPPSTPSPPLPLTCRVRLSDTRHSLTAKNNLGAFEFYITVGFYNDDPTRPGEVFITVSKEGSTLAGMCDALARTISLALQYGVPWEALRDKYRHMRFEPSGPSARWSTHSYSSIVDAVAATVDHLIDTARSNWQTTPSGDPASARPSSPSF